jgi:hypothetical protein
MKDMGNPFMDETGDLFTLDTKSIAHPSVAEMIASHYDNGKTRFKEFMRGERDRFLSASVKRSPVSSINGLPISFITMYSFCTLSKKAFCVCSVCRDVWYFHLHPWPQMLIHIEQPND